MTTALTPAQILALLPQRRPCRFVDEVLEVSAGHILTKYAWTEEDCLGHFPGNPVVPGVKMLEMSVQSGAAWGLFLMGAAAGDRDAFFTHVERAAFKKSVRPGDVVACRASFGKDGFFREGRMEIEVETKFLGGKKDGESIFAGKITGVWVPKNTENLK